jgi:hypothetical protein
MHVFKKIVGDAGNRNVMNIELIPFNEEEKKIEWSFELG